MTEQSKYLTEYLFNPAIEKSAIEETRQAVEKLRSYPQDEEANTALNCALDKVIAAVKANIFGPSPRLTDEENEQYIALKRKKLVERKSGDYKWYDRVILNDEEEPLFQKLEAKVDGRDFG